MKLKDQLLKGLSLERLQTFCLVAEKGGVMAAASGDPNRQSLYSRQIKELEQYFGVPVLDRKRLPHELSEFGMEVEAAARVFLIELGRLAAVARNDLPTVSIGAGESIIHFLLMPFLVREAAENGGWKLLFRNLPGKVAVEMARKGRLDLAVSHESNAGGGLSAKAFLRYGLRLVSRSPLGNRRGTVPWVAARKLSLAVLEGEGEWTSSIEAAAPAGWLRAAVRVECTTYAQVIEATATRGVCGLVPEFLVGRRADTGLLSYQLEGLEEIQRELHFHWNPATAKRRPELAQVIKLLMVTPRH